MAFAGPFATFAVAFLLGIISRLAGFDSGVVDGAAEIGAAKGFSAGAIVSLTAATGWEAMGAASGALERPLTDGCFCGMATVSASGASVCVCWGACGFVVVLIEECEIADFVAISGCNGGRETTAAVCGVVDGVASEMAAAGVGVATVNEGVIGAGLGVVIRLEGVATLRGVGNSEALDGAFGRSALEVVEDAIDAALTGAAGTTMVHELDDAVGLPIATGSFAPLSCDDGVGTADAWSSGIIHLVLCWSVSANESLLIEPDVDLSTARPV